MPKQHLGQVGGIVESGMLNFIQTYPVILPVYSVVIALILNSFKWFFFGIICLITLLSNPILKHIFRLIYLKRNHLPLIGQKFRPLGAYNCSGFPTCKSEKQTALGMPSGHSQFAWMVSIFYVMHAFSNRRAINHNKAGAYSFISIVLLFALLVSASRVYVGCHTIQQVTVGALIGGGMGVGFFYIYKAMNIEDKDKLF